MVTDLHAIVEVPAHHHLVVCPLCLAGLDHGARSKPLVQTDLETKLHVRTSTQLSVEQERERVCVR